MELIDYSKVNEFQSSRRPKSEILALSQTNFAWSMVVLGWKAPSLTQHSLGLDFPHVSSAVWPLKWSQPPRIKQTNTKMICFQFPKGFSKQFSLVNHCKRFDFIPIQ